MFPINIKGITKGLDISVFGVVNYSSRSESGHKIALRYQAYSFTGLPKDLCIISPQGICTSEGYNDTFISHCRNEHYYYEELKLREENPGWYKAEPVERVYINYEPKNNLTNNEAILPNQRQKEAKAMERSLCIPDARTLLLHRKSYSNGTLYWDILGSNMYNG